MLAVVGEVGSAMAMIGDPGLGVLKFKVLSAGICWPLDRTPVTSTLYSVFDCRFLKRTSGVRLVAATACPPATGVAVNLYWEKATPAGAVATACPVVGPHGLALVRIGPGREGMVMMSSLEAGL